MYEPAFYGLSVGTPTIGVRAIAPTEGILAPADGDDPYAVEMRRLDEGRTLERLVRGGQADQHLITRVAQRIAELHAHAPPAPAESGSPTRSWRP